MRSVPVRISLIVAAFLLCLEGCDLKGPDLTCYEQPENLRIKVITSLSPDEIRSVVVSGLSFTEQRKSIFYKKHGFRNAGGASLGYYDPDARANILVSSNDVPGLPVEVLYEGRRDVTYIRAEISAGDVIASSRYFSSEHPVAYDADFVVRIAKVPDSAHVEVSVRSFNAKVYSGKEFNGHVMGYVPKAQPVPPAHEEEYILLRYIAHLLGDDLPPLESLGKSERLSADCAI